MHPPRRQPVARVVVPGELLAHLVHPTVDDQGVLGRPGAEGPPAADLHADHVAVDHARPGTPVPVHRVRPPTPPVVEHRPRPTGRHRVLDAVDPQPADRGPRDVLDGVLEQPGRPRHDDPHRLVARRTLGEHLQPQPRCGHREPGALGHRLDVDREVLGAGPGRAGIQPGREGRAAGQRVDRVVADRLAGAPVVHPDGVHPGVVERRHGHPDQVGRRRDGPVLPALVAPPAVPAGADPAGVVQRMPGPPDRGRVQPPVRPAEGHLGGDLALGHDHRRHASSRCATCSLVNRWPGSSRSRTARKSSNRG